MHKHRLTPLQVDVGNSFTQQINTISLVTITTDTTFPQLHLSAATLLLQLQYYKKDASKQDFLQGLKVC